MDYFTIEFDSEVEKFSSLMIPYEYTLMGEPEPDSTHLKEWEK